MDKARNFLNKKMFKSNWFIIMLFFNISIYSQDYKILRIDSTKKNYIIDISKNNQYFGKIISKRLIKNKNCNSSSSLKINNIYKMNLSNYYLFTILNKKSFEVETEGTGTYTIDGIKVWTAGDSHGIYETNNLYGLCYR